MAGNDLIEAYLGSLARRLPADTVDELADGLTETHLRHRAAGLDPEAAARAAVAEFGEPDLVVAAFVRQAPGRRAARVLLCSGPIVGVCWAAVLIPAHAERWSVPIALRTVFGLTLLATVALLVLAATAIRSHRRTRLTVWAGLGLICLDGVGLITIALVAPAFVWPMALAMPASVTRMFFTARAVPRLLHRH
jgi:hypothetical protein